MRSTSLGSLNRLFWLLAAGVACIGLTPALYAFDDSDDDNPDQQYNAQSNNAQSNDSNAANQQSDQQRNRQQQNRRSGNNNSSRQDDDQYQGNSNRQNQQADRNGDQYDQDQNNQYQNNQGQYDDQYDNQQSSGGRPFNKNQSVQRDQYNRGQWNQNNRQGQFDQQSQFQNQDQYDNQQRNGSNQGYRRYSIDQNRDWNQSSNQRSSHPMLGITAGASRDGRVMVSQVDRNSPAAEAGLRSGDEIAAVNGARVERIQQLSQLVNESNPNALLSLSVWRDGRMHTLTARLQNAGNQQQTYSQRGWGTQNYGRTNDDTVYYHGHERGSLGVALSEGTRHGVRVATVFPNSPAQQAGIQPGDRLTRIDGQPIYNYRDVVRIISSREPNSQVRMEVDRDGHQQQLTARLSGPDRAFDQDQHATGSANQGSDQNETRFYRGQPDDQR